MYYIWSSVAGEIQSYVVMNVWVFGHILSIVGVCPSLNYDKSMRMVVNVIFSFILLCDYTIVCVKNIVFWWIDSKQELFFIEEEWVFNSELWSLLEEFSQSLSPLFNKITVVEHFYRVLLVNVWGHWMYHYTWVDWALLVNPGRIVC